MVGECFSDHVRSDTSYSRMNFMQHVGKRSSVPRPLSHVGVVATEFRYVI